jgi:hypothetical protein
MTVEHEKIRQEARLERTQRVLLYQNSAIYYRHCIVVKLLFDGTLNEDEPLKNEGTSFFKTSAHC